MTHLFRLSLRLLAVPTSSGLTVHVLECDDSYTFPNQDLPATIAHISSEILHNLATRTEHFCPAAWTLDFQWRALARKVPTTALTLLIVAERPYDP